MARKRYTSEQVIGYSREAEIFQAKGSQRLERYRSTSPLIELGTQGRMNTTHIEN